MNLDRINLLLPAVFQQAAVPGTPLYSLLAVMERLHTQTERTLTDLDAYFDPRRAPDPFIPMLARWVDLGWLVDTGDNTVGGGAVAADRLRNLVVLAVGLSRRRGTLAGLAQFLKTAVGSDRFRFTENHDSHGDPAPFHLWVDADPSLESDKPLIDWIVRSEKPAYLTHEITFNATPPGVGGA